MGLYTKELISGVALITKIKELLRNEQGSKLKYSNFEFWSYSSVYQNTFFNHQKRRLKTFFELNLNWNLNLFGTHQTWPFPCNRFENWGTNIQRYGWWKMLSRKQMNCTSWMKESKDNLTIITVKHVQCLKLIGSNVTRILSIVKKFSQIPPDLSLLRWAFVSYTAGKTNRRTTVRG